MKTRIGIMSIAALVCVSSLAAEPSNREYEVQFLKNNKTLSTAKILTVGDVESSVDTRSEISYIEKCDESSNPVKLTPGLIHVGNTLTLKPQGESDWVRLKWEMSELLQLESVKSGECQLQAPIVTGTKTGNTTEIAVGDVFTSGHGNYGVMVKRIK